MGSTTPSSLSSRTRGLDECSSAATEGMSRKIAPALRAQRRKEAATNSDRLGEKGRFILWKQSLIAHLHPVFSRPAWNSASVRAVAWPPHSSAPASALSRLPPARDPAFSARDRGLPASFRPPRNPALPATPAIVSRHHPSCPGGVQFPRARGAPRGWSDQRQEQPEIPSPRHRRVPRRAPAGRAECALGLRRSKKRKQPRSREARPIQSPREEWLRRGRS